MAWLSKFHDGEIAESFPVGELSAGDAPPFITIGSDPGNLFCLPEQGVAPFHAIVSVDDGEITITDQGSESGLFCNDVPIDETSLEDGDRVVIGSVELVFHREADYQLAASRRMAPLALVFGLAAAMAIGGSALWLSQRGNHLDSAEDDDLRLPDPVPAAESDSEPIPDEAIATTAPIPTSADETNAPVSQRDSPVSAHPENPAAEVEAATTAALPPGPVEPELSSPTDEPAVTGPVALFPQWHRGQEFRYRLEESKRSVSPQRVAQLAVSAEGSAKVIETSSNMRNRNTGEVKRTTVDRFIVSWQKLRMESDYGGHNEIFDSESSDNSAAGSIKNLGDSLTSGSRRAGVPIRNGGRPHFLNADGTTRFVVPTHDASWEVGESTFSNPSITPARLMILPHLAWHLPHGETTAEGARWSGSVEVNLDDQMLGEFMLDADYHLEKIEGSLAVVRVAGSVDRDSLRSGIALRNSAVNATIHVDVLRHVLTYYQSNILLEAAGDDGDPLRLEQNFASRLLNREDFSPRAVDHQDSTAAPPQEPSTVPSLPRNAGLDTLMLGFQKDRAAGIAQLVKNFRQALQRDMGGDEAATATLKSLETWVEQIREELGQPQFHALPAMPALPEAPAASARLQEVRRIFDTELTRIESENGIVLFGMLQAAAFDLRNRQQTSDAEAVLRYADALRDSKLIP